MADNTTLFSSPDAQTTEIGAYEQHIWSGGFNVASVDLIAMVVSDAGLASTEPQWWNASPLGCILLGSQPRGGWQVLQRAMQWGTDHWARCFGVDCKMPHVYAYFACSIRNRLEVWKSDEFLSPVGAVDDHPATASDSSAREPSAAEKSAAMKADAVDVAAPKEDKSRSLHAPGQADRLEKVATGSTSGHRTISQASTKTSATCTKASTSVGWSQLDRGVRGIFAVQRPTKLLDGSRGGQAFMCDTLRPKDGQAYSIDEQSRHQLLSVLLVVAGLVSSDNSGDFISILARDFGIGTGLSTVFMPLLPVLIAVNLLVIGFCGSIFYAVWWNNIYGPGAPYVIQLCSLASWSSGAMGLLMMGGHPRVKIDDTKAVPGHIQERLNVPLGNTATISFGSLHGSVFVRDRGSCTVPVALLHRICRWRLIPVRDWSWYVGIFWFSIFLLIGIVLQIAGSRVSTWRSECMSITLLILAAVLRGAGLAGSEEWMIPKWKRRPGAKHSVVLQGNFQSRISQTGV